VSINLEDVPYPHPVSFLPLEMHGQHVRMAYMDVAPTGTPNGRTAVLLHGYNFWGEYWAPTVAELSRAGFRVVVPDQVGYGRSSKPLIQYNLDDMAANTRHLLETLGVERAAIVGHSMGGMLASRFASAFPDVTTHVAMVNQVGLEDGRVGRPPRYTGGEGGVPERSYESIRRNIERYFVTWKPEYEKFVRIHWGWTLSGDWPRMAAVRAALSRVIQRDPVVYDWPLIRSRALVIGGAEDGPDYPEQARRVAESIPGAELVLIPNVGHIPHLESPEIFHARLIEFLGS
jgi:pimeloyl-ACP methyl ester carboxylesterase